MLFNTLALAATTALLSASCEARSINTNTTGSGYISYSTVTGYFLQDEPDTVASGFDYTSVNFGLINKTYPAVNATNATQWQQFAQVVNSLNANADLNTVYKILFMGRHGEGYHNAAESYYGTPAWNCYWSELSGNGTTTWADADLTPAGIQQALLAAAYWQNRIATQHIPYPQSYYTSPLTRCLRTASLTFSNLSLPKKYPFKPTIKELLREGISAHTCDRRRNRTTISSLFPTYTFEPNFPENDPFWKRGQAETPSAQDARSKRILDDLFAHDVNSWLSITSHSGEIRSLLRVVGHREFSLGTGAVIPVLVEGRWVAEGESSSSEEATSTSSAAAFTETSFCTDGPPVASGEAGCICSSTTATATAYGGLM